jgi:DinB superfamily
MTTKDLINNFLDVTVKVYEQTKEFLKLSPDQLNWRPSDKQWSVGECFEHLMRTNDSYIPYYQKFVLKGIKNKPVRFNHTLIGRMIINSMKPENKRKTKTPGLFNPIGSVVKESIVKDFLYQNNEIIDLVSRIDMSKLKEKITSPFAKYVKYNIGDSLMIIAYHNLRHLQQAKNVSQSSGFPLS